MEGRIRGKANYEITHLLRIINTYAVSEIRIFSDYESELDVYMCTHKIT